MKQILIVSGELSADRYGAQIVKALKSVSPNIKITALGGPQLQSVADHFLMNTVGNNIVGIQWGRAFRSKLLKTIDKLLAIQSFDKAIIIDYPHLNFDIAHTIKRHNIPIVTYITPNFWMWKDQKKARKIANYSDDIITIFRPEYEFYQQFKDRVHYFGHPLTEFVQTKNESEKMSKPPYQIAIFPGSRRQEFALYGHVLVESMKQFYSKVPEVEFVLVQADDMFYEYINDLKKQCGNLPVKIVLNDQKDQLLSRCDAAICASGSTTLELVLHRIPLIIVAALPFWTYWVARLILRLDLPFVGLPNVIAGHEVVPEYVQYNMNPNHISSKLLELCTTDQRFKMISRYDTLINDLENNNSVFSEVANVILKG